MALPDAVQNEKGRVVQITAYQKGTTTVQSLVGATMTGIIETTPGPSFSTRSIVGSLSLVDAANGVFSWTYHATDTATAGEFTVQFIATIGSTIIYRSFPEPWKVVRSPTTPS